MRPGPPGRAIMEKLLQDITAARAARVARDLAATQQMRKGNHTMRQYHAHLTESEVQYLDQKGALLYAYLASQK